MKYARRKALVLMLVTLVVWGSTFPVIKFSLDYILPLPFLYYRLALAGLVLTPIAYFSWRSRGEYLSLRRGVLLSVLGLVGTGIVLFLLYQGLYLSTVGSIVIIMSVNPAMTKLLLFNKHRIKIAGLLGLLLVFAGAGIVTAEPIVMGAGLNSPKLRGNLIGLGAAVLWSLYTVISKYGYSRQTEKNSPLTRTALAFTASVIAFTPVLAVINPTMLMHPIESLPMPIIPGLIFLGIFSSILGFMTFEAGSKFVGSAKMTRLLYFQPVVAIPIAIFSLGETISSPVLFGAGIIALGAFLTERSRSDEKNPS